MHHGLLEGQSLLFLGCIPMRYPPFVTFKHLTIAAVFFILDSLCDQIDLLLDEFPEDLANKSNKSNNSIFSMPVNEILQW